MVKRGIIRTNKKLITNSPELLSLLFSHFDVIQIKKGEGFEAYNILCECDSFDLIDEDNFVPYYDVVVKTGSRNDLYIHKIIKLKDVVKS